MVEEGRKAPEFSLEDQDGNIVRLADLTGQTVVLYFYPKDDTPGCTTEACSFRDAFADIRATGAKLFGISTDGSESHRKFRDKYDLPFPLLSDPDAAVARRYGVWGKKKLFGKTRPGMQRATVVIGPDQSIQKVFPKVDPEGHAGEVLRALS